MYHYSARQALIDAKQQQLLTAAARARTLRELRTPRRVWWRRSKAEPAAPLRAVAPAARPAGPVAPVGRPVARPAGPAV